MTCATQLNPNQPNHYLTASPVRARERQIRAPKSTPWGESVGTPTRIVLPFIRTTDAFKVQILSYDMLCH